MHCKIIALTSTDNKTPLDEETLCECGFVPWIADYCDDSIDEGIQVACFESWAASLIEKYGDLVEVNGRTIIFKKGFKANYTTQKLKAIRNFMATQCPASLKDYEQPFMMFYSLKAIIDDTHCLYISCNQSLESEDTFFWTLTEDAEYYFTNVVDYHM